MGRYTKENHFRIKFPKTSEELEHRLHQKGRYNIRRSLKKLTNDIGPLSFEHYTKNCIPEDVFHAFFTMKKYTHGRDYKMTGQEYILAYQISTVYALRQGEHIISVALSGEQCSIAGLSNITYDIKYSQYLKSPTCDFHCKSMILAVSDAKIQLKVA